MRAESTHPIESGERKLARKDGVREGRDPEAQTTSESA